MVSIPPGLLRSLRRLGHFDEAGFIEVHRQAAPPVSVRLNPLKSVIAGLPFQASSPVPWAAQGWYLSERPSFTLDPLFHAGLYYVQEASSMFLEQAFRTCFPGEEKLVALDACAAPGGKSTQLQSLLSPDSLLVSNETIKTRIPALYQNLVRWGGPNVVVSQNDPKDFQRLPDFFDLVVIDAPCSGSGLFRKDPAAAEGWNEDLVNLCRQRQQRIATDLWSSLKDDGYLIYCTCSFSPEENEELTDELITGLGALPVRIPIDPKCNILETQSEKNGAYGYRFYPDRLAGEGFFLSVIQKKAPADEPVPGQNNFRKTSANRKNGKQPAARPPDGWLPEGMEFLTINEMTHAFPPGHAAELEQLRAALYLKKAGILCGKPGAGEWIPDHELALAAGVNLPRIEVDLEAARRYLRKELDQVDGEKKGWQTLGYEGLGLGWIKKLPGRINNYYPNSWRILGKG